MGIWAGLVLDAKMCSYAIAVQCRQQKVSPDMHLQKRLADGETLEWAGAQWRRNLLSARKL